LISHLAFSQATHLLFTSQQQAANTNGNGELKLQTANCNSIPQTHAAVVNDEDTLAPACCTLQEENKTKPCRDQGTLLPPSPPPQVDTAENLAALAF